MDKMQNDVKFKNKACFKGKPAGILTCLNEYKKVVSNFRMHITKIKFNRTIPMSEEKIVFQEILPHDKIEKTYNEDISNFEYSFGDVTIKQFQCFVKKFA